MPSTLIIPDCFRWVLDWTGPLGSSAANVMHLSAPGMTPGDIQDVLNDHMTTALWSTVCTGAQVTHSSLQLCDGASSPIQFAPADQANWTGNSGAQGEPGVAAIISLQSGVAGRRGRGRVFLPFTGEQSVADGAVNEDIRSAVTAGWDTFATAIAADGVALGIASVVDQEWRQAVAISCEHWLATQKRRQDRLRRS